MNTTQNKGTNYLIPLSIIIAGAFIAGAVFFAQGGGETTAAVQQEPAGEQFDEKALDNVGPITSKDHILGDRNAKVVIVEYSDFECPFCKRFHTTMQQVMEEYGDDGRVAWVYRHFPLEQLHPIKASTEAIASECAAELGGNDAFWKYADRFFELTPSNNQTDIETVLPQIAQEIGLDSARFSECLTSGKYNSHVQGDVDEAVATGGRGTPWSIVISPNGTKFPLSGAQPYAAVQQLIEIALKEN